MNMTLTLRCNDRDAEQIEKLKAHFNHTQASKVIKRCIVEFFTCKKRYTDLYEQNLNNENRIRELEETLLKLQTAYMHKQQADRVFKELLSATPTGRPGSAPMGVPETKN